MQLNATIEDELHKKLVALSRERGTNLQELTRSALRALSPDQEDLTISRVTRQNGTNVGLLGKSVKTRGQITELHLSGFKLWGGTLSLSKEQLETLGMTGFGFGLDHLNITTENGRQGGAVVVGAQVGVERGQLLINFSGTSSLS